MSFNLFLSYLQSGSRYVGAAKGAITGTIYDILRSQYILTLKRNSYHSIDYEILL